MFRRSVNSFLTLSNRNFVNPQLLHTSLVTKVRFHSEGGAKPQQKFQLKRVGKIVIEGVRHVYHGFRLFSANTRLAWRYSRQLKKGVALTRRERMLLESSTKDLIRLVPFSFFIVVPFAELLLPVALKMFPGLIPSTFESASQGRNRAFGDALKTLRARQRMTEYVSATAIAMFTQEQQEVVRRVVTGDAITPGDIRRVAPYFGHDGPFSVYKIPDSVAISLGVALGVKKWYYSFLPSRFVATFCRRRALQHYHKIGEDDRFLRVEGLDDLTEEELIVANQSRGMRWTENKETLRLQMEWWNSLARDPSVPYNTLFWFKPTRYSLRKSMHNLPMGQRQQLLGIQNLPESVHSSLEALCETVDTVSHIDETATTADELAEKVQDITNIAKKSDKDIDVEGIAQVLGEYLTESNIQEMYARLRENTGEEDVVVIDVIDYLGHITHNSTHVVSVMFDGFDYGSGSKVITEKALLAIGARCRKVIATPKESTKPEIDVKSTH